MYVTGYITGAYFTGILTLKTNNSDVYNQIN